MFWFKVQPDIARDTLDFSLYDAAYAAVPERLRILANVAPEGPVGEGHARPGSYLPVDEEGYLAFVRAAVERYDGDGVDDMPGLTNAITCWQVGNEPNVIAKSGFAELQAMTHGAIKQACPGCAVLIGGTTGMPPTDEYIRQFDRQYRPILDALAGTGFDVMDVHWYGDAGGDYRGIREVLAHVRAALEAAGFGAVPIWITEMGTYSGAPTSFRPPDLPPQTERQQAADLFKRFVYSLASGVEKVFPAFGLIEGFKHDDGYFDHTGFIYDGWGTGDLGLGVKKLAYFTYAKTTAMLEGSDWQTLETVRESGNVHAYRLTRDGVSLYVAWWDAFDDPSHAEGVQIAVTISGLQGSSVLATEVVPDAEAGCDVADPATAFRTETVPVAGGEATIHLGDSPVVVVSLPWVEPRS